MSIYDYKLARPFAGGRGYLPAPPRRRLSKFTAAQCRQIRTEYDAGETTVELAKRYETSHGTISNAIRRAGGVLRQKFTQHNERPERQRSKGPRLSEEQRADARTRYERGETIEQIADALGRNPSTISRAIREAGGTVKRGRVRSLITPT